MMFELEISTFRVCAARGMPMSEESHMATAVQEDTLLK